MERLWKRAKELEAQEAKLHAAMPPEAAAVRKGKRLLLLLQELLEEIKYPDMDLVKDIAAGMPGLGEMPVTGAFPEREAPPAADMGVLFACARAAQAKVQEARPEEPELAQKVWDKTMDEVNRDPPWLKGPFTPAEVEARLGPCWVPIRRFPVEQKKGQDEVAEAGTPEAEHAIMQAGLDGE